MTVPSSSKGGSTAAYDPSLATVLENLNENAQSVWSLIPNRYEFFEGEDGYAIGDGGDDMYDGGNILGTNLGEYIPYTGGETANPPALGGTAANYEVHRDASTLPSGMYVYLLQAGGFGPAARCL